MSHAEINSLNWYLMASNIHNNQVRWMDHANRENFFPPELAYKLVHHTRKNCLFVKDLYFFFNEDTLWSNKPL